MAKWKSLLLLLLVMAVVAMPVQAWAADYIDLSKPVSLDVEYDWDGAQFDLYRVADVDKSAKLTACKPFSAYGKNINWSASKQWDELAVTLAEFVSDMEPLQSGMVAHQSCPFAHLQAGLYLVVGHELTVDGITYTSKPFLICLPEYTDEGTWNYHAMAYPKSGAEQPPNVPPFTPPPEPPPDIVPQTGQLWWPVPVLMCGGLAFVLVGVIRRRGGSHE